MSSKPGQSSRLCFQFYCRVVTWTGFCRFAVAFVNKKFDARLDAEERRLGPYYPQPPPYLARVTKLLPLLPWRHSRTLDRAGLPASFPAVPVYAPTGVESMGDVFSDPAVDHME